MSFKGQYLLLRDAESGMVLFCAETQSGEWFSVSYTHSVNKSPVSEHYQILDSKIYLMELRYKAFGAGMPTEPEEGQAMRVDGDEMVIDGFAREMPYLCYFVGRVAGHSLNWRNSSIPLDSLDKPGAPILFSAVYYPKILISLGIYPKQEL